MSRSGVGRSLRTASRLTYAPPTGERPFGSPSIQAAAERATVRADRTALRLGLRTLVVAGFAGAAWLLCANAAQAADASAADLTTTLSVVDLVPAVGGGEVLPPEESASTTLVAPVTDALVPARQPGLGTAAVRLAGASTPVGSATSVVLFGATADHATTIAEPASPAGATWQAKAPAAASADGRGYDDAGGSADALPVIGGAASGNDAAPRQPIGSVRGPIAAPGATGWATDSTPLLSPVARVAAPVTAPLGGVLTRFAGWLPSAAAPVDAVLGPVVRSVIGIDARRPLGLLGGGASGGPAREFPPGAGGRPVAVTAVAVNEDRAVTSAESRAADGVAGSTAMTVSSHGIGAALAGALVAGEVPASPVPVPSRGGVGPAGSIGGLSAPSEGGGCACAPVGVGVGALAPRRPALPAGVQVPRFDAEAPTVSPD